MSDQIEGADDDLSLDDAILIYSIAAGLQAFVPTLLYTLIAPTQAVYKSTTRLTTIFFAGVWWPTFIAWVSTLFFDSPQIREIFKIAVTISLGGPFFIYWVVITEALLTATDTANWASWLWWVLVGALIVYTLASIIFQVIFVPKVYEWVESAPEVESVLEEVEPIPEADDDDDDDLFSA